MSQNDAYYDPSNSRASAAWDRFEDYCDESGLDVGEEDFDAWWEDEIEAAEEAAAERAMEYAMEDRFFGGE